MRVRPGAFRNRREPRREESEPVRGKPSGAEAEVSADNGSDGAALPAFGATEAAERFASVRRANQSELAEDYVEMIDDLIAERGEARATDLAERFGVSPGTVARTIQRLARDGFVESQPYRSIFLTPLGKKVACEVRTRHRIVHEFLIAIGVGPAAAELDAEGIEHHVGDETLAAFRRFLEER